MKNVRSSQPCVSMNFSVKHKFFHLSIVKENFIEELSLFTIFIVDNSKIMKNCTYQPWCNDIIFTRTKMLIDVNLFRDVCFLILAFKINSTCGIHRKSASAFQWKPFWIFVLKVLSVWEPFISFGKMFKFFELKMKLIR